MQPRFVSSRDADHEVSLLQAIRDGLAPDGGLYLPRSFPGLRPQDFDGLLTPAAIAERLLEPFFTGSPLYDALGEICQEAFSFPFPLVELARDTHVLELFHGPTAAFKDVGARFMAACLRRIPPAEQDGQPLTILVATSGDTGGAVAAAFDGVEGIEVIVLYPKDRVSPIQEHQLCCWGANVRSFCLRGDFDACQALVKGAFASQWWRANRRLTSANSINLGRLLPQMVYYMYASLLLWRRDGRAPTMIVPSGNVGNALASVWARECGAPIGRVILASNANRSIHDWLQTGVFAPQPTLPTLANAMDVGAPSNMERLRHLFEDDVERARQILGSEVVLDEEIRDCIQRGQQDWGQIWCPHTACAVVARERRGEEAPGPHVIVSTAHPAKFNEIVEPLIEGPLEMPPQLASLLERETHHEEIEPNPQALIEAISTPHR